MSVYEHKSAKYVDQKTSNQNPCVTLTSVCTHAICKNPKLLDLKKKEVVTWCVRSQHHSRTQAENTKKGK